jgi:hypothetical protein
METHSVIVRYWRNFRGIPPDAIEYPGEYKAGIKFSINWLMKWK